ncbi:MAG: putative Ca2+/H+ antiporter (TMEM165/GDT1 family) [Natronomonas sp.]|jgi:putative Ca2+/H+ antiporter (TMEM165/GDT1 family)|uniref:TMEM165/GDT1 family protein n=1 Tax=Natronomonas sp. TaxID=2184060 RepID=UPI003989402E
MAAWSEVLVTAFLLQLLALPGEKGQLVIAGLATRYNPYHVVAGAVTAFGGWTILEIVLGEALKAAFPQLYLDALTATMFVAFAGIILYSHHRYDGSGAFEPDVPDEPDEPVTTDGDATRVDLEETGSRAGGYVTAFSAMGFAEFGDKTQLVTIGLAVQYGAHPAIWIGEMLAIVPVSLMTALVFHRAARLLDRTWFHYTAAAMFLLFAADIGAEYAFGVSVLPI